MPEEVKEILTSKMGNIEVTPQLSFIAHFKDAIPKYDEHSFKIKFIELFNNIGERIVGRTVYQKKKGNGLAIENF